MIDRPEKLPPTAFRPAIRAARDHARRGARARERTLAEELTRVVPPSTRGPVHLHLHLGHHRAAEGLHAHPRQLPRDHRHDLRGRRDHRGRDHLPLPAARALLRAARAAPAFDLGITLAYFGGDTKQIVAELGEVKPTYLPSVPRIFEKIYTLAHGAIESKPPEEPSAAGACIELGMRVRN